MKIINTLGRITRYSVYLVYTLILLKCSYIKTLLKVKSIRLVKINHLYLS